MTEISWEVELNTISPSYLHNLKCLLNKYIKNKYDSVFTTSGSTLYCKKFPIMTKLQDILYTISCSQDNFINV